MIMYCASVLFSEVVNIIEEGINYSLACTTRILIS